jgi:hypothetical protein
LWVDAGVKKLQEIFAFDIELSILERQAALLAAELRITTQRVNLFEKVKIPETKENIGISIFSWATSRQRRLCGARCPKVNWSGGQRKP